jgi:hypothetical protein
MRREFKGGVKRHDFRNHFEPGATQLRPLFRNLLLLNILRNRWVFSALWHLDDKGETGTSPRGLSSVCLLKGHSRRPY